MSHLQENTAADSPQASFTELFERSLASPGRSHDFEATGINIHYLEWEGPPGAPAVLLLHGFLGHAHWWDFIAPWLAREYRVVAPDFGGMGDSGHREAYSDEDFIAEIAAVIAHAKLAPCTLIGHSFGGRQGLFACRELPHAIRHAVIVDSRVASPADPLRPMQGDWRPKKRYASPEEMLPRFRLRPEEPAPAQAMAHLARHSMRLDGDAWVWKFDERLTRMFGHGGDADEEGTLARLPMPVDVLYGEHSRVMTAARAERLVQSIARARGPIMIPTAWHHIPVGQPLALLAALLSLLAVPA